MNLVNLQRVETERRSVSLHPDRSENCGCPKIFGPFSRRVAPSKRRTRALTHARLVEPTVGAELTRPSHGASTSRNSHPRARRAIPRASVAARRR